MGLVKTCMLLVLFSMAETVATAQMQRPSPNYGEQSTVEFELRRWRSDLVSELRLSNPEAIGSDFDPVLAARPSAAADLRLSLRGSSDEQNQDPREIGSVFVTTQTRSFSRI